MSNIRNMNSLSPIWDFLLEVSKENMKDHISIDKFGRNTDIDAATSPETVWDYGGAWQPFASGEQNCTIESSSANDTTGGTGAITVSITGISSGIRVIETVTLNGLTLVDLANTYTLIERMEVLTVGSTGSNVGILLIKGKVDTSTVIASIGATHNQTRMVIGQVPTGYKGFMYSFWLLANGGSAATTYVSMTIDEKKNIANSPWVSKIIIIMNNDNIPRIQHTFNIKKRFSSGSYIRMNISTTKDNLDISAGWDLLFAKDV